MGDLFDVVAATWPAAGLREAGGFLLRRGEGGGNRTSAATRAGGPADIALAEAGMRDWGQVPLFLLRPGEAALDAGWRRGAIWNRTPRGCSRRRSRRWRRRMPSAVSSPARPRS